MRCRGGTCAKSKGVRQPEKYRVSPSDEMLELTPRGSAQVRLRLNRIDSVFTMISQARSKQRELLNALQNCATESNPCEAITAKTESHLVVMRLEPDTIDKPPLKSQKIQKTKQKTKQKIK